MRHGVRIDQYELSGSNKLDVGITFGRSFREVNACVAAGLDYSMWRYGGYQREMMDEILAWYDLTNLISAHSEDAKAASMKKGKKGKK